MGIGELRIEEIDREAERIREREGMMERKRESPLMGGQGTDKLPQVYYIDLCLLGYVYPWSSYSYSYYTKVL